MSSSYKRIESNAVYFGESFVLSGESDEDTVNNLTAQKKSLQIQIDNAKNELDELNNSLKELFAQKDTIIENAKKEGEGIKTKAILKAEETIAQTNAQKSEIVEEAKAQGHKQGFEAGYNDGTEKFKEDYTKQINSLNALTNASFAVKNEIVFSAETDILELAILIAEKIVQVEFEKNKDCFRNMTQTAISLLKEKENIRIVVNPKLLDYAQEIAPELAQKIEGIEQIKIIQDKAVSADGVVVESIESRIDARISTQIETLARNLLIDKRSHEEPSEEVEEKIAVKIKKAENND